MIQEHTMFENQRIDDLWLNLKIKLVATGNLSQTRAKKEKK